MSMSSIITQLQSLIDASNLTTGKEDTDLTTAVERLIRGWGGSAVQITEVDATAGGTANEYISFTCEHEPDIVAIYAKDWDAQNPVAGAIDLIVYKEHALGYRKWSGTSITYNTTSQIDSEYPYGRAGGNGVAGGSYSSNTFEMRARGNNGWAQGITFRCIAITF